VLHGRAAPEGAFARTREPALLAGDVDLEALLFGCVAALVAGTRDDPVEAGADARLDLRDDGCERVPVLRVAGPRLHVRHEWVALAAVERARDRDLDPKNTTVGAPGPY
jgi:hypothetical protein